MIFSSFRQVQFRLPRVTSVGWGRAGTVILILLESSSLSRWPLALVAVLLALVHGASYWGAGPIDDDFICQVFGRSLAQGRGFAWWGEVQVEGFTVPLWVALHGLGQSLGLASVDLSRVLGIASMGLAVWALGSAWRLRMGATHGGPAWVLAAAPAFAFHACAGLGTTLLAAMIALWLRSLVQVDGIRNSPHQAQRAARWAGVWLGLACLLRQECALLWLVWVAFGRSSKPADETSSEFLPRGSVLPLLALAGWSIVRWTLFDRLLPISYSVKSLPLSTDLAYGWQYLMADLPILGSGFLGAAALIVLLARPLRSVDRVISAGFLVYALFIIMVGGDFVPWSRFFVPAFPLGLWCAALIFRRTGLKPLLVALPCLLLQWPSFLPAEDVRSREARFLDNQFFEQRWSSIGRWVASHAPVGTRLGTSPIGAIAWYSKTEVLDLLGLVHPHALGVDPDLSIQVKGHHRSATGWMLEQRPEWIILGNGTRIQGRLEINPWERDLFQDPAFQGSYERFEVDLGQGPPLDLFVRKGLPIPEGVR